MRITVLTPSYNQAKYIEETIHSVMNQEGMDIEHIIVDGGSTDSTVDILKKYPHLKWISEKDEGQADALQKGLKMATGDIVGWINSDDYLAKNALQIIKNTFEVRNVDWVVGNFTFVYQKKGIMLQGKSPIIKLKRLFSNPDILRQPGTFFKRDSLIRAGGFNKKYQLTMDLDLWFRLLRISEPFMLDENIAFFRIHEAQKTSGKHILKQLKEMLEIYEKNEASNFMKIKLRWRKYYSVCCLMFIRFMKRMMRLS